MIALSFAAALASCRADSAEHSQAVPKARPGWLLTGYQTSTIDGIDSAGGRIWKDGGPEIHYDIGSLVGEQARGYAKRSPTASLSVVESGPMSEVVVALDEDGATMVVSINHRAHFSAQNVRSRKDVLEVMLMANAVADLSK